MQDKKIIPGAADFKVAPCSNENNNFPQILFHTCVLAN